MTPRTRSAAKALLPARRAGAPVRRTAAELDTLAFADSSHTPLAKLPDLSIPLSPFLIAGGLIGVLGSLATHSVMPGVLAPPVALLLRSRLLRNQLRAAETDQRSAVVDFCAALRAELQAGRQPSAAIADAVWCRPELRDLAEACAAPTTRWDPPDLLALAARAPGREGLAALAACWRATERHGVALTEAVGGIEDGLRAEQQRRLSLAAELAGVRATAALLGVLPVLGLALGSALGANPVHTMLTQPVGEACLLVGFLLEVAGLRWTDRLVGAVVHESRPRPARRRFGRAS